MQNALQQSSFIARIIALIYPNASFNMHQHDFKEMVAYLCVSYLFLFAVQCCKCYWLCWQIIPVRDKLRRLHCHFFFVVVNLYLVSQLLDWETDPGSKLESNVKQLFFGNFLYHIYVEELRKCERQEVRMQVIPRGNEFAW